MSFTSMQLVNVSPCSASVPRSLAVVPLRAPPGLHLDLDDIGPPPGLPLPGGQCTSFVRQTSDSEKSTTYCLSANGSSNTSDSEPDVPYTSSSGIRLRGGAPAFVPAECRMSRAIGKEFPPAASPGAARTSLRTTATMFMPRLPYVPKVQVDQAWQEWTAASTQVPRRRGVRGGRKARRAKADVAKEEQ